MQRSLTLDILRTAALIMMVIYHALFDAAVFGWNVDPFSEPMIVLARTALILFLIVAGASFAAKRERGWKSPSDEWTWIKKRTYILAGASLLVTLVTWITLPNEYVQFGVLHMITVGTLLLWALPRSSALLFLIAGASFIGSFLLPLAPTEGCANCFLPLGIVPSNFQSIDYVPLLPWFGFMALGCALWPVLPRSFKCEKNYDRKTDACTWAGRHSLIVYLVHQPVLWGIFYVVSR